MAKQIHLLLAIAVIMQFLLPEDIITGKLDPERKGPLLAVRAKVVETLKFFQAVFVRAVNRLGL